jgi:8-oxo-dGTP pyrophosphatase MutT (NUDIX family)
MVGWRLKRQAARVVVFDPHGRVLLIRAADPARRHLGQWWEIPGGGIDPGEQTHHAVRRELWEEAGISKASIGPVVWTQEVTFTFGGMHFDQREWIHVAHCDGSSEGPRALEALEAMAFTEQRWWDLDDLRGSGERTIPYRLSEFVHRLRDGDIPEEPIDISPEDHHVESWHAGPIR